MKTTNLETSKKLKELGFEAKSDFFFAVDRNYKPVPYEVLHRNSFEPHEIERLVPAYDLEKIIEAFPKTIKKENFNLNCCYALWHHKIKFFHDNLGEYQVEKKENESLANTAGRLLVKLLEDNIIKLGE
jgi:hypothetical protein